MAITPTFGGGGLNRLDDLPPKVRSSQANDPHSNVCMTVLNNPANMTRSSVYLLKYRLRSL